MSDIELHKIINKNKVKKNIDIEKIENDLISMKKIDNHNTDNELNNIIKTCKTTDTNDNNNFNILQNIIDTKKVYKNTIENESETESEGEIESVEDEEVPKTPIKKFKGEDFMNQYEKVGSPDFVSDYYGDIEIGDYKNKYNNGTRHEIYNLTKYNVHVDEQVEEEKEMLIIDIEEMLDELSMEHINLSRIPEISDTMPIEVLRRIYKRVKRKYDRHRCEDLGKNICIALVRGLERICNGQNRIFGLYPDLTGWHRTVRSKLSKLKYEQSIVVTHIIEKYNVGPSMRLAMELIPSAAIYSINKQDQRKMELQTNNDKNNKSEVYDDLHVLYG